MLEMLNEIFQVCIVPLLGILTAYLVSFISVKKGEIQQKTDVAIANKYIEIFSNMVNKAVIATNQTYVEALKGKNAFNKEEQLEAFKITYNTVLTMVNAEMAEVIKNSVGDLDLYLTTLIEAAVSANKY